MNISGDLFVLCQKVKDMDKEISKIKRETKLVLDLYDIVREMDTRLSTRIDCLISTVGNALGIKIDAAKKGKDKARKSEPPSTSKAIIPYTRGRENQEERQIPWLNRVQRYGYRNNHGKWINPLCGFYISDTIPTWIKRREQSMHLTRC